MSRTSLGVLVLAFPAWAVSGCEGLRNRAPKQRSEAVVAVWAEPARLPVGGGQVHILVRIRRPTGEPYPGVQVRLKASQGRLFSGGKTLVTDAEGMTRDRLTSKRPSEIVVLAGQSRHHFKIEVTPGS